MSGLRIPKKKNMSMKSEIKVFNKPEKVFVPLIAFKDTDITILVKKDDYVCKGTEIGRKKGNFKVPIFSPISGKILDIEEHTHISGKKVKCVVIENDFKEKAKNYDDIKNNLLDYTKQEFIESVKKMGIVGLGGAGFPTYAKYDTDAKKHTLIVNAVECEPYITADAMFAQEKSEEILEVIDAIISINNIDQAIIAVKKHNTSLIESLETFLGSYLNIKLVTVPNIYPMGWEKMLIKQILGYTYEKLPIEKGIVVNNISTLYALYEALKFGKPLTERVITISGEGIKKPQNVLVKIGTRIMDIVEELGYNKKNHLYFIAGGPMMGETVETDLVVSPELNCVLLLKEGEESITECIRCGKCIEVCPSEICPVLIKDVYKSKEKLKKYSVEKCVECGLCSYVCPAKINVREFVKKAKETIREVK